MFANRSFARTGWLLAVFVVQSPKAVIGQSLFDPAAADSIQTRYRKVVANIPMRDGVKLRTHIFVPRDTSRTYPFLMYRTPYGIEPYEEEKYPTYVGPGRGLEREGFIFVNQDVRGRNYSEGTFIQETPHKPVKRSPKDVDESSDTYDTIEWLLKNVPRNNGKVGLWGISYLGFYTVAGCIDSHPALVACSPQAPMIDVAAGDDLYHNGAFLLAHPFPFFTSFNRGPRKEVGPDPQFPFKPGTGDGYKYFLETGPLGNLERNVFKGTAPDWVEMTSHPNHDAFWKVRDLRPHLKHVTAAFLYVGGWYDAEDLFGPLAGYRAVEANNPGAFNAIVMGPWFHGQWLFDDGSRLGHAEFGGPTSPHYQDEILLPFFRYFLKGGPKPDISEANVFETGTNLWRRYDAWPPANIQRKSVYLHAGGKLTFTPPARGAGAPYDEYLSDPAKPVPTVDWIHFGLPREYMTADQRFASRRPDVLVYQTEPLAEDITIAGPLAPKLYVATSGTDADFIVKLIDVYPEDAPGVEDQGTDLPKFRLGGYQRLVRGEPFRGRFRRSFEHPVPLAANQPDSIQFVMPDILHTFKRGHRIMVQIQSSWFPHIDRNPQTFVRNIFQAKPSDFRAATMRIYHSAERPTQIEVGVLPPQR